MNAVTFRFSTEILRRLGEELISTFDQGIVELVKNAYDADARTCTVQLIDTGKRGGTVVITDDGDGMSREDIEGGWLVLGRSRKVVHGRTRLGRLPAGSKGLGRLGALRMGENVVLETRPRNEPGVEYSLCINWSDFESTDVVENVPLFVNQISSHKPPGTRISIGNLKPTADKQVVTRLARELLLLANPFVDIEGFRPNLIAPEFEHLEERVRSAYFDDCEFKLTAHLDRGGDVRAVIRDRSGRARWESAGKHFNSPYLTVPGKFDLWVFLLRGRSFSGRSATMTEVRNWLRHVGGVHLYHRGLRVRPYGDPGHDWLDMNLSRSRDPELRPSTNTSVGRIVVDDPMGALLQRTDRSGFIETESFKELRRFATDALQWLHTERLDARESGKAKAKARSKSRTQRARHKLEQEIQLLPTTVNSDVATAAKEFESATDAEREGLRDEVSLYKTLASVGTSISVFAHEIEGPAADLALSVGALERRGRKALSVKFDEVMGQPFSAVKRSAGLMERFATLPLSLLKQGKRNRTVLDTNACVSGALELFGPYLEEVRVDVIQELNTREAPIHASVADIEAIISNLVTNAVKAFKRANPQPPSRTLLVRTHCADSIVLISVLDSGPGIRELPIEQIWLPGKSVDENGTGLGLTIVRDTVTELGGRATAVAHGELGGAEFLIELPRAGAGK